MSSIKTLIDAYIKRNANQEITGPVLNGVLTAIADALGTPFIGEDGYWYEYDQETGEYVSSGTPAQGESGVNEVWAAVGASIEPQPLPSVDVIYNPTLRQLGFTFYDIQGPRGPQGTPGITGASVSVDANVGTPSVDASIVNSILTLAFHNLRGAAAGFGTPTISVGANQGTPSASVTASGPDTAKVFHFAFDGLKGETGPQGPQGPQGNPGSNQDYPFTLANNLTTDDSTVALTAAMGVQLEGEVSQLSQKVGFPTTLNPAVYPGSVLVNQLILSTGKWSALSNDSSTYIVPILPGSKLTFENNSEGNSVVAFLRSNNHDADSDADFSQQTGFTERLVIPVGTSVTLVSPIDASYFSILATSVTNRLCTIILPEGSDGLIQSMDIIQKKVVRLSFNDGEPITPTLSEIPGAVMVNQVVNSSNKWSAISSNYVGYIVPVSFSEIYEITGGVGDQAIVAFLTSDGHSEGSDPAFSSQQYYSARLTVAVGETKKIPVPFDAHYMYVLVVASNKNRLANLRLSKVGIEQILYGENISQASFYEFDGLINPSNLWIFTGTQDTFVLVPIPRKYVGYTMRLRASASRNSVYAFLSAPPITGGSTTPSFSSASRVVVPANSVVSERIPNGTTWLYIFNNSANQFQSIEIIPAEDNINTKGVSGAVEDTAFSWWTYPLAITTSGMRKKLINGWVDSSGNIGISVRDFFGGQSSRIVLDRSTIDDHNAPAVIELSDGRLAVVYARGHNNTNNIYCRVSSAAGDYVHFDDPISVAMGGLTSYAQVFKIGDTYYIFSRTDVNDWSYVTTEDFETFTSPHVLISASAQHYVKFVPVADEPNILRMAMYFNPTIANNSIRLGYIDFDSGNIYSGSVNNENIVGTLTGSSIANTDFIEIITSNNRNRLFDIAVSNLNKVIIAYSTFTLSDTTDSVYHIYENGAVVDICHGGPFFYNPSGYMGGISFRNKDELVLARADSNNDRIEVYERGNNGWEYKRTIFDEKRGTLPIRNIRPIFDTDGLFLLWQRGKYELTSYTEFFLDIISALYVRL